MSRSIKNKIIGLICIIILGTFFLHLFLRIGLNTNHPFGVVLTDSMAPTISRGDLLFLRGMNPSDIKVQNSKENPGDIIAFDASGLWEDAPSEPIVHRVVKKWKEDGNWYFQTKGDANPYLDKAPIPENRVIGVVCGRIPFIGFIAMFFVDLRLFGIFILFVITILIGMVSSKKKKKFTWSSYR